MAVFKSLISSCFSLSTNLGPLLFVVSIFTMYNWDYIFSKSVFSNFDSTISSTVLGENLALKSVLGNSLVQVGTFANLQFIAIIFIFIILISFVYSLKFDEVVDGIISQVDHLLLLLKTLFQDYLVNLM